MTNIGNGVGNTGHGVAGDLRTKETDQVTTIKDVARLAGVGLGTASRALSGHGCVAADTRRRVSRG